MRRKLAAGNWKMHGDSGALAEIDALRADHPSPGCDLLVCPPATLISRISARAADTPLAIGGQDCHAAESGAHTGDIAAAMLAEAGATYVILGHSERRAEHGEDDATVRAKAEAALAAGLIAVLCIGETEAQRDAGDTLAVLGDQLAGSVPDAATGANLVVAYEPVWAIGTGRVPSAGQIGEVHDFLRASLARRLGEDTGNAVRLLYGGSVKAANAAGIFAIPNVDGALVGGASLRAADFSPIVGALEESG